MVTRVTERRAQHRPRWLFAGQGAMGAAALEALLAHRRPVAACTQESPLGPQPVTAVAEAHGCALHHIDLFGPEPAARWPDVFDGLDAAIACCWTERLSVGALGAAVHGWFNLHPSALPAWRGADPIAWQLLARPAHIGCTVHRMTEVLDDGPVLTRGEVPVTAADDRGALLVRTGTRLGELAAGVLDVIAGGGTPEEQPQDRAAATSCPPPGTVPLVDPHLVRAADAARLVRAFSPQPGIALTVLGLHERFSLVAQGPPLGPTERAGTVAGRGDGSVEVAFADGWLHGRISSVEGR